MIRQEGADTGTVGNRYSPQEGTCKREVKVEMTIHDLTASYLRAGSSLRQKELNCSEEKDGPKVVDGAKCPARVETPVDSKLRATQAQARIEERTDLPEEQVLEIRQRITDGFYELPSTVEEVALRILGSGDLD